MSIYLGRNKGEKKESVIGTLKMHRVKDKKKSKVRKKSIKEIER
ncbi:hypothetical protein [Peptacetobacter sp.]|nr:hypothetical protein [Peptacetobacter sp.]